MKKDNSYEVRLPNLKKSELKSIKQAAEIKDTSIRKFIKHVAIDTAEKILQESKPYKQIQTKRKK